MYKIIENFFPGEGATISTLYRDGIVTAAHALKIADLKNQEAAAVRIDAWYEVIDADGKEVRKVVNEKYDASEPDYNEIPF
tara:strand:- start:22 stop:264 length:243 start_codon:yes stop_codon:yes gene_type:complete